MSEDRNLERDGEIRRVVEARRADETKIMQKVNAANREAFHIRFPGQLEHSMRLIAERLQMCLAKPAGTVLDQPSTWPAGPAEIESLCRSLRDLEEVRRTWPIAGER